MIGHYLLTLTPEQEERVLTRVFLGHNPAADESSDRCLVQVAEDIDCPYRAEAKYIFKSRGSTGNGCTYQVRNSGRFHNRLVALTPATQYDNLCDRFGTERVNVAIRNRILANQAHRALTGQREAVTA